MTELSVTGNERIRPGGNLSPFDVASLEISDLASEAETWLTGAAITSDDEAKAVETLLGLTRDAKKHADEARRIENEPFDTGKAAVQARYNPILKRADTIADTCKAVLEPWRKRIADEKLARAEAARNEALAAQAKAQEAFKGTYGDIVARQKAEELLSYANEASGYAVREAKRANTGTGLRRSFQPVLTDGAAAATHYWNTRRADFEIFLQSLAERDVRAGIRSIPGFAIREEQTAI